MRFCTLLRLCKHVPENISAYLDDWPGIGVAFVSDVLNPQADNFIAVAVLRGDSNVKGTVTFEQASEGAETTISWDVSGNDANAERGMHVHAFGDNTNGCTSAGPHCESDIVILDDFVLTTASLHSQPTRQDSRRTFRL